MMDGNSKRPSKRTRTYGSSGRGGRVTHQAIADVAGVDRTTVTKVLNRSAGPTASEETKRRVFEAAARLGYDLASIHRAYKRGASRSEVGIPCALTVVLADGQVFDTGTAVVVDLSLEGALLGGISLPRDALPIARFTIRIDLSQTSELEGVVLEAKLARFAGSVEGRRELGVEFVELNPRDRERLERVLGGR